MVSRPTVARVVVNGWTWCKDQEDNVVDARRMLHEALKSGKWPSTVKFAVTPGGFVRSRFSFGDIRGGWDSERYFERLKKPAGDAVTRLLTNKVKEMLRDRAQYLTVGVDLNNTNEKASPETHAELVAVVDAKSGEIIHWTGKSYPTGPPNDQSRTLVQAPLKSHCFPRGKESVLILGCHDLHMFGGRGRPALNGPTRKEERREEMLTLAKQLMPQIVLQHPHTTHSPRVWSSAWGGLRRLLPKVSVCASGISFCGKPFDQQKPLDRQGWSCQQTLERVLASTKRGPVVDVVVQGFPCEVEKKWKKWAKRYC